MNKESAITLFWFRRDLRLDDNHGLYEALSRSEKVLCLFIFDKEILRDLTEKNDKRLSYIHQSLEKIQTELRKKGSSLYVVHDEVLSAFHSVCSAFPVKEVITNHDYEPYALQRDAKVSAWLQTQNIAFRSFKDQVIFEKSEVIKADGKPYTVFTPYARIWKQKLAAEGLAVFGSENLLHNLVQTPAFALPSLAELGFIETAVSFPPPFPDEAVISNYHLTRNFPAVDGCSRMSPHLRFGTVSIRKLVATAVRLNEQWLNELIWREFFMMILYHFPKVITESFKKKYDNIHWRNNEAEFELWCQGETGYPMVDAGLRELNETGLMHNRVRMITASFLTKHLLIDWRWGESYFAEKLLDYELSSNNGNWQWAAGCGCDAAPYFRIFNPEEQQKKFDPDLKYIKKWIKNYRPGYCLPVVEHKFARERVLREFGIAVKEFD